MTVDRDGSVSMKGDMRMLYATMMKTRGGIYKGQRWILHLALLVAIRYSIVRR